MRSLECFSPGDNLCISIHFGKTHPGSRFGGILVMVDYWETIDHTKFTEEDKIEMAQTLLRAQREILDNTGSPLKENAIYRLSNSQHIMVVKVQLDNLSIPYIWLKGRRGYFFLLEDNFCNLTILQIPKSFEDTKRNETLARIGISSIEALQSLT